MANNVDNVSVGKPKVGGAIWTAPVGTTLPTDAVSDFDAAFVNLGYVSEDGVVNNNTPESENIKAWGGDIILTVQTSKEDTYKYTLVEVANVDVLKHVYGSSNVSGDLDNGITITANSKEQETVSIIIEMILNNTYKRVVIPKGKVATVGEITYVDESAVGYETTVACLPDSEGNTHYEYIQKQSTANTVLVTFDSNGGSAVASQRINSGSTATQPDAPTKDGYTFGGWYDPNDLSNAFDFTTAITENITLYAKWTEG